MALARDGSRALPVDRSRGQIVDAVFEHRITLVQGGTGCGKSSRVPQFLLEAVGGPVLCTQPRRLAVVSIASRVAEERGARLGGEQVGYRIGQRPHCTSSTQIVFATAGVVLEDLKGQGVSALLRFRVIILDEAHERSVESDLLLACIRELMREHRRLKLVLMSATCDFAAYAEFFKPVSEGRLARVQINDMGLTLSTLLHGTTVKYLDEVVSMLAGEQDASGLPLPIALGTPAAAAGSAGGSAAGRSGSGDHPGPATPSPQSSQGSLAALSGKGSGSGGGGGGGGGASALQPVGPAALLQYRRHLERLKSEPQQLEGQVTDIDQRLLRDLVAYLHRSDGRLEHAVLVFLPTYKTLELQHELLLATGLPLAVFALHSSIDIDECVAAMGAVAGGRRKVILATNIAESSKRPFRPTTIHNSISSCLLLPSVQVILATNIAESSVTIPGVRYVVDACRTLQLSWNRHTRRTSPNIVFASRSQADQRKGRTGRTCEGTVYRLLPRRTFLDRLAQWERPAMELLHLRRETLGLLCATSAALSHPPALLAKCMTPPEPEVATDALAWLAAAGAARLTAADAAAAAMGRAFQLRGSRDPVYEPSALGRFLAGLPVSVEAALLVATGGKAGLLRAAVLLSALQNVTPLPIHQPFASPQGYRQNLSRYGAHDPSDTRAVLLANLAAYEFWQHAWCDRRRLRKLRRMAGLEAANLPAPTAEASGDAPGGDGGSRRRSSSSRSSSSRPGDSSSGSGSSSSDSSGGGSSSQGAPATAAPADVDEEEQRWCLQHSLIRSSLHSVAELAGVLSAVIHQHRPDFLASSYFKPGRKPPGQAARSHACSLKPAPKHWGNLDAHVLIGRGEQCAAPYALLHDFFSHQEQQQLEELLVTKDLEPGCVGGQGREGESEYYAAEPAIPSPPPSPPRQPRKQQQQQQPREPEPARHPSEWGYAFIPGYLCGSDGHGQAPGGAQPGGYSITYSGPAPGALRPGAFSFVPQPPQPPLQPPQPLQQPVGFASARQLCRFFATPRGCNRGLLCPFSHDASAELSDTMRSALARPVRFWREAAGGSGGKGGGGGSSGGGGEAAMACRQLFAVGERHVVLLLGEGDLSFTEALLHCTPARLTATVHLERPALLAAYPSAAARLDRLEQCAAQSTAAAAAAAAAVHQAGGARGRGRVRLEFGVCATRLHEPGSCVAGKHMPTHIVANFPHTGRDEDDEAHRGLMAALFASAAAALLRHGGGAGSLEVLLTLCNDQFSRWHVEAAAREAFFFLTGSAPFDPAAFPGYKPRRGDGDEDFPLSRAVTYRFASQLPPGAAD